MAQLYADENFPLPVVMESRNLGHDVLTSREAGKSDRSIPDDEVLASAAEEGRAVLTLNRLHFIRLHRNTIPHPGIIVCTYDANFTAQAARIEAVISGQKSLHNQLMRVNRPSV